MKRSRRDSPDGKSLLQGSALNKHGEIYDVNAAIWNVPSRSKTALFKVKGKKFLITTGTFSTDGDVLCGARGRRDPPLEWATPRRNGAF